ncbi:MAG: hypothetical protein CL854_05155 [Cryomorphaceae bacterium]|jgi:uncharacterized protein (DUF1015 family)|nr:hypothetical protein [Cryomorphaceae bacterium]MDG1903073.1 DUF1015 domain-containing protein [Schleiferiaceae bacterium]
MLRPFKAVRPTRDKAYLVATRSYITYGPEELDDKLSNNPYTFLHVINPNALPELHYTERFSAVRSRYNRFEKEGIFIQDDQPTYYLYEQSTPTAAYTGVIGLLDAESVVNGTTLPHEKTIAKREHIFARYLGITGFQAEPVLVFGEADEHYDSLVKRIKEERPEYEFSSTDKYSHRLWVVPSDYVNALAAFFEHSGTKYIADGHHRLASSVRVAQEAPDNPLAQGILCMFMAEEQVGIESFERWFDLSSDSFELTDLEAQYDVSPIDAPSENFQGASFQLFFEGNWHSLHSKKLKGEVLPSQELLDTILNPLLDVVDPRNDARLHYHRQTELDRSAEMLQQGYALGFRLPPVSVKLLKEIAVNKGSMPPKSTYIEPKLRSGLLLHLFK